MTNYESLTMAAQFDDVTLPQNPQKHELDQVVNVPPGEYTCRVTQLRDPDDEEAEHDDGDSSSISPLPGLGKPGLRSPGGIGKSRRGGCRTSGCSRR